MGSAAAALIFGAGIAHADESGSPSSNKVGDSSASTERSGSADQSSAAGPKKDQTAANPPTASTAGSSQTHDPTSATSGSAKKDANGTANGQTGSNKDENGTGDGRTLSNQKPTGSAKQKSGTTTSPSPDAAATTGSPSTPKKTTALDDVASQPKTAAATANPTTGTTSTDESLPKSSSNTLEGITVESVVSQPKSSPTDPQPPSKPTPDVTPVVPAGRQEVEGVVAASVTGADSEVRALNLVQPSQPSQPPAQTQLSTPSPSALPTANAVLVSAVATPSGPSAGTAAVPPAPNPAQVAWQFAGLANDIAAFNASLTYDVALGIAQAVGPNFLGGGPYYSALAAANAAANLSKQLTSTPLNATAPGQFPVNFGVFDTNALLNPAITPAGANDPTITVTAEHPLPIILVNGTGESQGFNWSVGSPVLANAGYKVYSFNYGSLNPAIPLGGLADIRSSAQELSNQIDSVLAETGAEKVILVGHSQGGGILPAYYLNVMGGTDKVSQLIGIAPSNHGTDLDGVANLLQLPILGPLLSGLLGSTIPALEQQTATSPFQQVVYGNGDTRPGVLYTNIVSAYDEVVTPYQQQFLTGPNVTNILIQDQDPGNKAGHLGMFVNSTVWSNVLAALAANPAANPQVLDTAIAV